MKENKERIKLANGKFFDKETLKKDGLEVIDNNIIRHKGMVRFASKNPTAFQQWLQNVCDLDYAVADEEISHLFSFSYGHNYQGLTRDDELIIDAYNDRFRRFFESLLAKKILSHYLDNSANDKILPLLIKEMTAFYVSEYQSHNSDYYVKWMLAKNNKKTGNDDLDHYTMLRSGFVQLISQKHFSKIKSPALLSLYDLHYLTHQVTNLNSYKIQNPQGMFELYSGAYPHYRSRNRGRIAGYGFNKNNLSYHLGIFRSCDITPMDMRRAELSKATRCPDRLYMVHPKKARANPDNWLHKAFNNPYNSCYVNGLSGSMLLELRSILFFIQSIKTGLYTCNDLKASQIFTEQYASVKQYLLLIMGIFIYYEGGHTFSEVLEVLNIKEVKEGIEDILGEKDLFSFQTLFLDNAEMKGLIRESLVETAKFYANSQAREAVHNELLGM